MGGTKELFERIASALESGELPTVDDSVAFELLCMQYWEKETVLGQLGLVSRAVNRTKGIGKMSKDDIQTIVSHLVQQHIPKNGAAFAQLLYHYIDGRMTASDLLGERERKPRNGYGWQHYDQLGEQAESIHMMLIQHYEQLSKVDKKKVKKIQTGNRSLSNGLNDNLYDLLSKLSNPSTNLAKLKKDYGLADEISLINTGFLSPSQWRDCHLTYKKFYASAERELKERLESDARAKTALKSCY